MATLRGRKSDPVEMLNDLIALDFDAVEAYQEAIERLDDAEFRSALAGFMNDHVRHTRELSAHVRALGGEPRSQGDFKRVLTAGKVKLADLVGEKAILKAMKSNEDDTNQAYEQAVGHEGVAADVKSTLQGNLEDERRHRAWIESQLEHL